MTEPTTPMNFLLQNTPELLPATGVIHSVNAKVWLAGFEILRVQDFSCRVSNSIGQFAECGRKQTIPFAGHYRVTGSMRRAYVNGAEWRLGLGVTAAKHHIGVPLTVAGDDVKALTALKSAGGFPGGANTYPLKFDIVAICGADALLPSEVLASFNITPGYQRILNVKGAMIDALALNFGIDGLVTSGPIEFLAEFAYWVVDQPVASVPPGGGGVATPV